MGIHAAVFVITIITTLILVIIIIITSVKEVMLLQYVSIPTTRKHSRYGLMINDSLKTKCSRLLPENLTANNHKATETRD